MLPEQRVVAIQFGWEYYSSYEMDSWHESRAAWALPSVSAAPGGGSGAGERQLGATGEGAWRQC